jgi:hypothetical protein
MRLKQTDRILTGKYPVSLKVLDAEIMRPQRNNTVLLPKKTEPGN